MPKDHDSFRKIKGVGESKLRQFGDQFITIIAGHVTGNEDRVERKQSPAAETPVAAQVPRSVLSRPQQTSRLVPQRQRRNSYHES